MEVFGAAFCGLTAHAATTVALYPYRDYVGLVTSRDPFPVKDPVSFMTSRYKGMLANPSIPVMIAVPMSATYTTFVAVHMLTGSNGVAGVFAGTSHALTKRAVKVFSNRMGEQSHRGPEYKTPMDAIRVGTQRRGIYAWIGGSTPMIAPHILWYGVPLMTLSHRRRYSRKSSFGGDVYDAFKIHAFCSVLSAPFRNLFRSVLHRTDYTSLVTFQDFVSHEKSLYHEAYVVGSRMLREAGPMYFFQGNLKTVFRTSLPWAVSFALYRKMSGPL
jgi:hypothetical protein